MQPVDINEDFEPPPHVLNQLSPELRHPLRVAYKAGVEWERKRCRERAECGHKKGCYGHPLGFLFSRQHEQVCEVCWGIGGPKALTRATTKLEGLYKHVARERMLRDTYEDLYNTTLMKLVSERAEGRTMRRAWSIIRGKLVAFLPVHFQLRSSRD